MAGEIEVMERDSNKRFAHFYKMDISDAVLQGIIAKLKQNVPSSP